MAKRISNVVPPERQIADILEKHGLPPPEVNRLIGEIQLSFRELTEVTKYSSSDPQSGTPNAESPADVRPVTIFERHFAGLSREALMEGIKHVLLDALGADDEEVIEEARLENDLGAESIDYLDIVFRIEKEFGIEIPRGELFSINDIVFEDDAYRWVKKDPRSSDDKIFVTDAGLAALKRRLPQLDVDTFAKDPDLAQAADLHTVGSIVRFLEFRQQEIRQRDGVSGENSHVRRGLMP